MCRRILKACIKDYNHILPGDDYFTSTNTKFADFLDSLNSHFEGKPVFWNQHETRLVIAARKAQDLRKEQFSFARFPRKSIFKLVQGRWKDVQLDMDSRVKVQAMGEAQLYVCVLFDTKALDRTYHVCESSSDESTNPAKDPNVWVGPVYDYDSDAEAQRVERYRGTSSSSTSNQVKQAPKSRKAV